MEYFLLNEVPLQIKPSPKLSAWSWDGGGSPSQSVSLSSSVPTTDKTAINPWSVLAVCFSLWLPNLGKSQGKSERRKEGGDKGSEGKRKGNTRKGNKRKEARKEKKDGNGEMK